MAKELSPRLTAIVDALPLRAGIRVLEIGCGPGAAAREIARRIGRGHVLAIDRSARAIAQAKAASRAELASGILSLRQVAVEDFALEPGEAPYDIALAVRVGALDGRHRALEARAKRRIAAALRRNGALFIDGGTPLQRILLNDRESGDAMSKPTPVTVYGIKNCDTMKKARAWLDARGVAYAFHDYKAAGIDRARLEGWARDVGWETLLNRAGTTFRALSEKDKADLSEKKAIALMLAQPSMIKRPVLETGKGLLVGFKPDQYEKSFAR